MPDAPAPLFTQTQTFTLGQPLSLAAGCKLDHVDVAYETYGTLNDQRNNAVLICHAWTGDAHVAGYAPGEDPDDPRTKPGWWDQYVGPGKAVDTDRYFVICSNLLGGCKGTTGPASINPDTGKPWGVNFPVVTIGDMVEVQRHLIDHLGIEQLLAVVGGSMGGMQVLEWAARYPDRLFGAIPIATTASLGPQALAFDSVGRNAIKSDPDYHDGRYYEHDTAPRRGLSIARMLGHITFLSDEKMREKFGRDLRHGNEMKYDLNSQFSIETYLDYKGGQFVDQFDANSYMYLTRAMDLFDLGHQRESIDAALAKTDAHFLVLSFSDDWLFTPAEARRIAAVRSRQGRSVSYLNIPSNYGHDAFLLPSELQERAVGGFLNRLLTEKSGGAWPKSTLPAQDDETKRLDLERIDEMIPQGSSVLDLGCGDGTYLAHLRDRGCARAQGVDIDGHRVVEAIERGVDVVHADLDQPIALFDDHSFDFVLLSRTLQVVRHPPVVLKEMTRIGRKGIVTFPNFGYWRNRHQIAWRGRVPVSRNLPFTWADTPNLHYLAMHDFEKWCADNGVRIERRIGMDYAKGAQIHLLPNLRATDAIYLVSGE
jgi:homoserine O-acetyltransferase